MGEYKSMSDGLERLFQQIDRLQSKVDDTYSLVSDIRANEQIVAARFENVEKSVNDLDGRFKAFKKDVDIKMATKEEVRPLKTAYNWGLKTIITAVLVAVLSLVISGPAIKQDFVINKKSNAEEGE